MRFFVLENRVGRQTFPVMQEVDKTLTCVAVTCLLVLLLPVAVTCIVIGSEPQPDCALHYADISFDYAEWMFIKGIADCAICGLGLLVFVLTCWKELVPLMIILVWVPYALFSIAWYIVGGVLLFSTMTNCNGEPLWTFGLTLFIFQSISFLGSVFGKSQNSD